MDGMLSDIMEEFNKRDIVFDSDRQMERFAPIMMETITQECLISVDIRQMRSTVYLSRRQHR